MRLQAGAAVVEVDALQGGRIASLSVAGVNLLAEERVQPLLWGLYPMVPWVGRLRDGKFWYRGRIYRQPLTMPPHAIHGTAWNQSWQVRGDNVLYLERLPDWPFAAAVEQQFALTADGLDIRLQLRALEDTPFPASIGWHPCFATRLAEGGPAELDFRPGSWYQCDESGIPTGVLLPPPPGPWDDCFTHLRAEPVIRWPGFIRLTLASTCSHWICFNRLPDVLCVEPVTGPPNALNLAKVEVAPGQPLEATMSLRWQLE